MLSAPPPLLRPPSVSVLKFSPNPSSLRISRVVQFMPNNGQKTLFFRGVVHFQDPIVCVQGRNRYVLYPSTQLPFPLHAFSSTNHLKKIVLQALTLEDRKNHGKKAPTSHNFHHNFLRSFILSPSSFLTQDSVFTFNHVKQPCVLILINKKKNAKPNNFLKKKTFFSFLGLRWYLSSFLTDL